MHGWGVLGQTGWGHSFQLVDSNFSDEAGPSNNLQICTTWIDPYTFLLISASLYFIYDIPSDYGVL
jgi:hypothetical protein